MVIIEHLSFESPLGPIVAAATFRGICLLHFGDSMGADKSLAEKLPARLIAVSRLEHSPENPLLCRTRDSVLHYLERATPLPALPLDTAFGTPFQRKVWAALCEIPFGETRTYSQIAAAIGQHRAARAVGHACGRNPLALIVPCHRVVGAGGKVGGYTGGLHVKKHLLALERPQSI